MTQNVNMTYTDLLELQYLQGELEELNEAYEDAKESEEDKRNPGAKERAVKEAKAAVDNKKRDLRAHLNNSGPRYKAWLEEQENHARIAATVGLQTPPRQPRPNPAGEEQPMPAPPPVKEMKIADPAKYNGGSTEDYTRFRFECQNIIKVRTSSLDTDEKKVAFIGSRMEGDALVWYEIWSRDRDRDVEAGLGARHTLATFLTTMDHIFKDPMEVQTARNTLASLRQGGKPFNSYQVAYLSTCIKAGLEPDTQLQPFLKSLNPKIVRDWHPQTFPTTYTSLVESLRISIEINNTLGQLMGSGGSSSGSGGGSRGRAGPNIRSNPNARNYPPDKLQYDGSKPGPFYSNTEKPGYIARERQGWCTRCGMSNHKDSACRIYPHSKTNKENYESWEAVKRKYYGMNTVNAITEEPKNVVEKEENKVNTTAYLHLGMIQQGIVPLLLVDFVITKENGTRSKGMALIDSGANRSLIGREFVNRNQIPSKPLPNVLQMTLADGKTKSHSTKQTHQMDLEIQGHQSRISAAILENHGYDLILGLDWLSTWNPHIDWRTQAITFMDAKPTPRETKAKEKLPSKINFKKLNIITDTELSASSVEHENLERKLVTEGLAKIQLKKISDFEATNETRTNDDRNVLSTGLHVPNGNITNTGKPQINTYHTTPTMDQHEKAALPPSTWPMSEFPLIFDMEKQSHLPELKPGWDFDVEWKEGVEMPKNRPLFRLPISQRKAVQEYVDSELESGKIRISNSPIAANLFFVPKGDSSTELRPCVDYRDLNSATKDDKYPLPPLAELIQGLVGGDWYSKLDWRWAYNNLRIVQGSEWKFAFKCHLGQFEPLVMPFGPKQAPAHMQRYVSEMCKDFAKEGWLFNILDDFVIKTVGSIEDHKNHIRRYLKRIQELGIFIKESKCLFFQKEIPFVGFMVNRYGYWKQEGKLDTIRKWGVPTTVKEVRAFIGFVNFYRPFAKNLSIIAQPLFDLTKKSHEKFSWLPEHQAAFDGVKLCLLEDIFLLFPDHTKPFIIHFDSSDLGTGAALQQYDINGGLRPLEFYSKKWNAAEFNYSTPDKELYGLVLALKHWYPILFGADELVVYTDHKSLRDFSKTQLLKPRHARWALVLEDFRSIMKIRWIPGSRNSVADACSRDPRFKIDGAELEERAQQTLLPEEVFEPIQANILYEINLIDFEGEEVEEDEEENEEETEDGSLRKLQPYQTDISEDLEKQKDVLSLYHDSILGGHLGFRKTLESIRRRYWWKGLRKDVMEYVSSCDICQKNKKDRRPPAGKLKPLPIPDRNWQHVTMDFIVKLPKSSGFDSILVVVDRRSKQSHFIKCKERITAEGTAMLLFQHVISKHGLPQSIVSDRGPQFRSRFWKKLLELLGCKASLSTAYHPQTDGQSERVNQTLEQYLRIFTSYEQDDWSELLPLAELVYNNSYNESIGMSPLYAATGQDAEVEFLDTITPVDKSNPPEAGRIKEHFSKIYDYLNHQLKRAQERYKRTADMYRREEESYKVNDKVLLATKNIRTQRPTKKLDVTYVGPYRIKRKINPVAYELDLPIGSQLHPVYHVDLLKPYIQSEDENRTTIQPPSLRIDEEEGYIINDIIDVRPKGRGYQYLIDWRDYGPEDRTWETRSQINDDDLLRAWHESNPDKPSPFNNIAVASTQEIQKGGENDDTIVSFVLPLGSPSSNPIVPHPTGVKELKDIKGILTQGRRKEWKHDEWRNRHVNFGIKHVKEDGINLT